MCGLRFKTRVDVVWEAINGCRCKVHQTAGKFWGQEKQSLRLREGRRQQQIPFGNDRQKSKGKGNGKGNSKGESLKDEVF
jgi:hypothetical protein